jgi:integrase
MSITKIKPNVWQIKVSARVPGKDYPVKYREQFCGTKTEAEYRKAEIVRQLKSSSSLTPTKNIRTFDEAIELYLVKLRATGRLSKHHQNKIELIRREFGHLPLEAVPEHFETWLKRLANTPGRSGKLHAPATLNRQVEIVRAVFNHLVVLDELPKNPITPVRFPKRKEKARDRYLTLDERARLLNAIRRRRPEMLPLIQYMLLVPCRVSELTMARREQYNPFTNMVYIPDSKADIPIYKPVPEEMTEYFRNIPIDCPWLFYWKDSRGQYRPFVNRHRAWADALKMAGIENFRIHDLRHMAVTDLLNAGNDKHIIKSVAGWKTDMLTIYYHKDGLNDARKCVFQDTGRAAPAREEAGGLTKEA